MFSIFVATAGSKIKTIIWPVLLVAFLIRLFVPVIAFIHTHSYQCFHASDTPAYMDPAKGLIATGRYTNPHLGGIAIEHPPGYPLLLVPGLLLKNPEVVTIAIQIIFSCLTVYLVYKIALLLLGRVKVAALCAFLYAIEPLSILYTTKLMSETLYTTTITLFLYFLLKYIDSKKLNQLIISSIILAASAYVRPIGYYSPFLMTVFLLIWIFTKVQNKKILLIHVCVFFVVSMGLIGIWEVRNRIGAGYPGFAGVTDMNLYFYKAGSVLSVKNKIPFLEMQNQMGWPGEDIYFRAHPEQRTWTRSEQYVYMRDEGKKIIRENLFLYSILHLKGMMQVLFGPGGGDYVSLFGGPDVNDLGTTKGGFQDSKIETAKSISQKAPLVFWVYLILGLILGVYLLLAVMGLIYYNNWLNKLGFMALLSLGFYLLTVAGGQSGYSRFRHPLMPLICILAGYGLSVIFNRIKQNNSLRQQPQD